MSQEPDLTPDDIEREAVLAYGRELEIAALKGSPALTVLLKALEETEEAQALKIGGSILQSVKPVDQRTVDFTRGYYAGARYYLRERVSLAQQRVSAYQAEQAGRPEGDPRPTGQPDPRIEGDEAQ
jgi:hypothetical protein